MNDKVVSAQDAGHGDGHDYVKGSPHLRHTSLRTMMETNLKMLVGESVGRTGTCRVLEIGAGHGTFTRMLLDAGATVTVTEASAASAAALSTMYAGRDDVSVFFDETGESAFDLPDGFDAVVCAALLHHIPDYLTFVDKLSDKVVEGGWFYSAQDPLYYPRRDRRTRVATKASYYLWRVAQGDLRKGLATRVRRLRGVYDDSRPEDLIEYHVVRDGVDELALKELLSTKFEKVDLFTYWSTQAPMLQRVFENGSMHTDFGLIGRSRKR